MRGFLNACNYENCRLASKCNGVNVGAGIARPAEKCANSHWISANTYHVLRGRPLVAPTKLNDNLIPYL